MKSRQFKLAVSLFLATMIIGIFGHKDIQSRLLLPPQLPRVAVLQKQVNDVIYFAPQNENDVCWATKLPCTIELREQNIKLLDPKRGIKAGFGRGRNR